MKETKRQKLEFFLKAEKAEDHEGDSNTKRIRKVTGRSIDQRKDQYH